LAVEQYYAKYTYDILGMLTLKEERRDDETDYLIETHYAYDENRNLKEIRSGSTGSQENNHVETYQYNSRDLPGRKFIGGEGTTNVVEVNYRYDADGRLASVAQGSGIDPKTTNYDYDGYGRLSKIRMPENVTRRFWHDRNGNVTDEITVGPETGGGTPKLLAYSKYEYDQLDRLTLMRTLKENAARTYTETSTPPALTSPIWFDQSYVYTPNSQIKEVSSSSGYGEKLTYTYDGMNRVKSVTDEKGNKNTYSYDSSSYLTEILEDAISDDPNGMDRQFNTTILRDFLGRSYQVTNGANETTLFERDRYGNVLRKIEPGQTSETGAIQEFDALGRLVHAKSTLPGTSDEYINTYHSWDDSSRKKSSTDPAGIATTYVYNALSQLEFVRLPYHGETGFQRKHTYNKYGELENVQDSNGTTFVLGYDNLGRLVSRTATPGSSDIVNSGNESFAYDGLSRVINATKGEGASVVTRKYDTLSNLREETAGGNTTKFEWDGLGNLAKMTYPGDREASYAYDTGARLNTITDATFTTGITYDYLGGSRTESIGLSTGLSVKVAYDTASRVSGIDYKAGNTTLYNMDFDWTPRGNLDLVESVVGNRTTQYDWSYDNAERLTGLDFDLDTGSGDNEKETSFLLFPSGAHKRVTRNGAGFSTDNAVSGSAAFPQVYENYVEDVPGSTDTTWHEVVDANGNRKNFYPGTNTSGGHTYIYDQDNRLVSYSDLNDVVTTYTYDAFGRRIAKTTGSNTTRYVYAGWDVIQERNGSNELLRSYLLSGQATDGVVAMTTHDPATGAAEDNYFYLKDARGNVVALATPAGAVVERYVYDAYGTPTVYNTAWGSPTSQSPLGNPYLFQSRNYDSESGLYYYRLRYMDPFVGRFITPDPIGNWGDAANLGNPYTYVGNNPWNYSDPFGLQAVLPPEAAEGVIEYWTSNDYWGPRLTGQFLDGFIYTFSLSFVDGFFVGDPYYGQFDNLAYTLGGAGADSLLGAGIGKLLGSLGGLAKSLVPESLAGKARGLFTSKVDDAAGTVAKECPVDRFSRNPKSLQDEMALEAARKGEGEAIIGGLGDPRYRGWEKMEYRVKSANGRDSVVHYVRDPKTGFITDFKFTKHSTDGPRPWGNDPPVKPGEFPKKKWWQR
jgi:RHS repeat-associated protein